MARSLTRWFGTKLLVTALLVVLSAVATASPSFAGAGLPGSGTIVVNVGEAGVDLGATQTQAKAAWGNPYSCNHATCFYEDYSTSERAWITFGGTPAGATRITTTVSGWKTPAGIHVGSTKAALFAAYGSQLNTTACGGANWPCILGTYHGHNVATIFQLISGTIANVEIENL
jgi:hypothetical protein